MTDTERLNLIEHYGWHINKVASGWNVFSSNIDIIEKTLRLAIDAALAAQIKWSLG